jgi:hypothetical protein
MKEGRHRFIVGKTRSGKSNWTYQQAIAYQKENPDHGIIVINHKRDQGWNKLIPPFEREGHAPVFKRGAVINWCLTDDDNWLLDTFLRKVIKAGRKDKPTGCLIIIDESQSIPQHFAPLKTLLVQGAGMGISVWMLTQRPAFVSLFGITQSSEIIVFNVMGLRDQETLNEYMEGQLLPYIRGSGVLPKYNYLSYDYAENAVVVNEPCAVLRPSDVLKKPTSRVVKTLGFFAVAALAVKTLF